MGAPRTHRNCVLCRRVHHDRRLRHGHAHHYRRPVRHRRRRHRHALPPPPPGSPTTVCRHLRAPVINNFLACASKSDPRRCRRPDHSGFAGWLRWIAHAARPLSNRRVIHGLVKRSGDQATGEPGCAGRHRPCMKFRFVLLDPDGDSHRHTPPRENAAAAESADPAQAFRYQIRGTDMVRQERLADGRHRLIPVANFRACIVSDIILDDGVEQQRHCGVEAELDGQKVVFTVPAVEFGRMGWVLPRLGPRAIIYPGQTQHARAAIQELSGPIRQERIFSHLGWRKPDLDWVYLHAGGALGAAGLRSDWQVQLPAPLQDYRLQVPPQADELARAIQASLDLLRAAPDRVSFPLLAAVYRAALGGVSFSVFLSGPSGVFKSALAALCQQHFGAAMEASRLPANFASTGNALELLAFSAKDALLVVDDFAPQGGTGDGELHNVADRLFRGAGNQQGRFRLGANGRLRAAQAPRGLVLGTGEEVPQGQSIRARLVILELGAGEVDRGWLSRCQQAGRDGRLAASMGGFVRWVAGQYEGLQRRLDQRVVQIRSQSCGDWGHARTPAAMAELQGGWEIFLQFAMEVGALSRAEKEQLQRRGEGALGDLAQRQAQYQAGSDPAWRFVALASMSV